MLGRQVTDLRGLLADDVLSIGDVGVDELAVLDVDEWGEVGDGGEEEGEAPRWCDFDEEVADECCREGLLISH